MAKNERAAQGKLAALAKTLIRPWSDGKELIEVRQAILDEVADQVVAIGDDQRIFPFNHLRLHLHAAGEAERTVISAAVAAWDLPSKIRERLAERHCIVGELTVEAVIEGKRTGALRERPFFLEYQQVERRPPSDALPELMLTVMTGDTPKRVRRFRQQQVLIGRLAVVLDENGAAKRRNDLAFDDSGSENETVSRAHARIDYRREEHAYALIDERSSYGSYILRSGRRIPVSSRDPRGVRLRSGDVLCLGRAEVRCAINDEQETEE